MGLVAKQTTVRDRTSYDLKYKPVVKLIDGRQVSDDVCYF